MSAPTYAPGIEINGRITPEYAEILSPEAVAFAVGLQRSFGGHTFFEGNPTDETPESAASPEPDPLADGEAGPGGYL